jgi:uncharacterized lipoprotein YmbA
MTQRPLLQPILLLLLAAALTLSGCAGGGKAQPQRQTFFIDLPAPRPSGPPLPGILLLEGVDVAEAFAGKQMVYRFGDNRYQSDYYNEFLVSPREMIGQRALEWLQGVRLYETVAPLAGSSVPDAMVLRAVVNEMYADLRDPARPAAVLSLQLYVTAESGEGQPLRFAQQLRSVQPMRDASAQAYADALSRALEAVLWEAERQMRRGEGVKGEGDRRQAPSPA